MRATGIIRRVDELGRIVIPKEIRRTLKIEDGDPIEFFIEGNNIILQRYTTLSLEEVFKDIIGDILKKRNVKYILYSKHEKLDAYPAYLLNLTCKQPLYDWTKIDNNKEDLKIYNISNSDKTPFIVYPIDVGKSERWGYLLIDKNSSVDSNYIKAVIDIMAHHLEL